MNHLWTLPDFENLTMCYVHGLVSDYDEFRRRHAEMRANAPAVSLRHSAGDWDGGRAVGDLDPARVNVND